MGYPPAHPLYMFSQQKNTKKYLETTIKNQRKKQRTVVPRCVMLLAPPRLPQNAAVQVKAGIKKQKKGQPRGCLGHGTRQQARGPALAHTHTARDVCVCVCVCSTCTQKKRTREESSSALSSSNSIQAAQLWPDRYATTDSTPFLFPSLK